MSHATFIVYHEVPLQNQDTYERWLRKIINTAARFEGHLGVDIVQPASGSRATDIRRPSPGNSRYHSRFGDLPDHAPVK